ncbi:penicillin-binding protein 1A [Croceivirga lutea]|uniref:transglycosylase domain-containing protein n=1 Tax=Croceivirga lutea TaxID=1775167 RepID=UPI00163B3F12|nr:transglycosylase domain-containing protein [Croceivirga lutea]GGG57462.1 penicillin-binding protein 1A [Croceivirga lutea]
MNRKRTKQKNSKIKKVKWLLVALIILAILPLSFIGLVAIGLWGKLPSKEELSAIQYQKASEIYSADSVLIGKFYLNDRQPIPYSKFPKHLVNALIAIEDERFYDHNGTDFRSLVRVGIKSIVLGDKRSGGGSTLTQQLAKNLYPRKDRKRVNIAVNKVKEMLIARKLEKLYSKKEVLHLYLNTVSFGDNTFGIEAASRKFFNKQTNDLKIEEAAVLVGMLKATYGYNPRIFPEKAKTRRDLVFYNMEKNGFLSSTEKDSLNRLPLKLDYRDYDYNDGIAPYFREAVRKELASWTAKKGYNLYTSGLKIYTTLDYNMQYLAEEAMLEHMKKLQQDFEKSYGKNAPWLKNSLVLKKLAKRTPDYKRLAANGISENAIWDSLSQKKPMKLPSYEGEKEMKANVLDSIRHFMKFLNVGSLGVDPHSGAVKTWIGGINFSYFKYDHVNQSKRQVGSTFKPIVYSAALEDGVQPCDYFSAREVEYENLKGWSPSNSGDEDEAYLNYSLEQALSNSINTVTVKVLEKTGMPKVLSMAKDMGITATLPNEPSIALGTGELSIKELVKAYTTFVNNSIPVEPYFIERVTTETDAILAEHKETDNKQQAFSDKTRMQMLKMMEATVNSGTASRIRSTYKLQNAIAGKTGTTQNNKDAWFAAITPNYVNITWVGLDNHEIGFRSTALGQGANAALPVFAKLYSKMNADTSFNYITKAQFEKPSDAVLETLDCEPVKRDGFLKRLFTNPNKKKKKRFRG